MPRRGPEAEVNRIKNNFTVMARTESMYFSFSRKDFNSVLYGGKVG
jgi:hypothetical protein